MTTTDLYAPLTSALVRLFPDYDLLADFARRNLGLVLNNITDRGKGLVAVTGELFDWAAGDGKDKLLLVLLYQCPTEDHALQAMLQALVAELGLNIADFPALQTTGFKALQAAAANPVTRAMIAPYRLDLQQLCLTAIRIGGWKYLHDNVDHIRNQVWAPLALIAKGPPQPGHLREAMTTANLLGKFVRNITDKASEMKLKDRDMAWVSKRLLPAQASLQAALQPWPGMTELGQAEESLRIVTGSDLSLLNGNIKIVAASIEALNLEDKLQSLQDTIATGMADRKAAEQTGTEIRSMARQVVQLLDLVDRHDTWQLLKDGFDDFLTVESAAAARDAWGHVNPRIEALIDRPELLDATRKTMVDALAADDFYAIQNAIVSLNSIISDNFLAIDGDLLNAAEDLGKMGTMLGRVLETFDD